MDDLLTVYREQINEIDAQLLALLQARFNVSEQIGLYKKRHRIAVVDMQRELEMRAKRAEYLGEHVHRPYIEAVWSCLIEQSKEQQRTLLDNEEEGGAVCGKTL